MNCFPSHEPDLNKQNYYAYYFVFIIVFKLYLMLIITLS